MWWLDPGKEVLNVLFNRILAPYVENLDLNQVNYGIAQGQLTLRNLKLKKGVLDKFQLPVDVLEGHLGTFTLSLHWINLGNQPVEILIEDVYLLVVPSPQTNVNAAEEEARKQAAKAERLESAELLHVRGGAETQPDSAQTQGLIQSLITKIINNVQVTIKNIHVRYEDKISVPGQPFAVGVTLASFAAVSVDGEWKPAFIESTAGAIHKLAQLQSLAMYFDTEAQSMAGLPQKEAIARFSEMISDVDGKWNHQYILKPVSGEGRIIVNHHVDRNTPRFNVELLFDEIGVSLDDDQYRHAISLVDMYQVYMRKQQYKKYLPQESEVSINQARSRLQSAAKAILSVVHEKNRKWTWAYFAERRDDRNKYVDLFQKKLLAPLLGEDLTAFEALERKLAYEDLRFYRSIARSRLRKDQELQKRLEEEKKKQQTQKAGWGTWLWGDALFNGEMTEEQRKQLYDVLDYDEKSSLMETLEAPRDSLKMQVTAKLKRGSLTLKTDPHGVCKEAMSIVFDIFNASFIQRPGNFEAILSLQDFRVFDGTTPNTLYPQIVSVKKNVEKRVHIEIEGTEPIADDPFFYVKFENNPLDDRADNAITARMRHMEIIYHKGYVEAIYKFFKPPASQLESVEALLNVASETLEGLRKETRAGLEYALQTHKTVDLHVDMNAPIIIIPEDITTKECSHLILDAGHISIESDLADKTAVHSIYQKRNQQYDEEDYRRLESLMYDKMSLKLQDAQFVIGRNLQGCLDALTGPSEDNLHLLERINISFQIQKSIVPTAVNLAQIKVAGTLPSLQMNLSDAKYHSLMRLVDIAIPKFNNDVPVAPTLKASDRTDSATRYQLPPAPTLFRPSNETEYNVDDDSDDDDTKDEFFEAESGTNQQQVELHQRSFELEFQVGTLRAALSKSTADGQERPLGELTLQQFALTFGLAKFNMDVDVNLRSVSLVLTQAAKRMEVVSTPAGPAGASTPTDLLKVKYVRAQRESPEFESLYEGIDQTVDVRLSTLVFHVEPEPILAVYDFIMTTFVPSFSQPPSPITTQDESPQALTQAENDGKIRVLVKLQGVQVVFVNDSAEVATLDLSVGDVSILTRANSLRVSGRLGSLALLNDNKAYDIRPEFNQLLSIEGENFADFTYQTFDPSDESYAGVKSSVHLNAASVKFTYLEQPLRDLYAFLTKLARLKYLYDAARVVAVQTASEIDRMQFSISVKSPILVFPSDPSAFSDIMIMRLGHIKAENSFKATSSKVTASLYGIKLVSSLHRSSGEPSQLKIIDDINVDAEVVQTTGIDRSVDVNHPDTQVAVKLSDIKLHLTQTQYVLLMHLSRSIPRIFTDVSATPSLEPGPSSRSADSYFPPEGTVSLQPELRNSPTGGARPWTATDLVVNIGAVKLHLYDESTVSEDHLKEHGIARFALNDNTLRLKQLSDGSMEAQVVMRSFTMSNTRPGQTKFREIIPAAAHERNQFMILYTSSGTQSGTGPNALAVVTVDSPQIIFAVDPVFALLQFFTSALVPEPSPGPEASLIQSPSEEPQQPAQPSQLDIRVDLHDVSVSILENETDPQSRAIQLHISQVLFSQQGIMALNITQLGMSLMRMGRYSEVVRFLDNLDLTVSLDNRSSSSQQMSNIEVNMKPVVLRASYRDINLITTIVNRAIELYSQSQQSNKPSSPEVQSSYTPSAAPRSRPAGISVMSPGSNTLTQGKATVTMSKEQLKASLDGFRFILIGDLHEQPMLHLKVKPFIVGAKDWSGPLRATTTLASQITYWNLTNSHWEPLIDPWTFTVSVTKDSAVGALHVSLSARERLDVNLSTTFAELAVTMLNTWSQESTAMLQKPRGTYAPYRIRNRTGTPILVWSDVDSGTTTGEGEMTKVLNNQIVDWRFDDWKTMREHVSSGQHNIGIRFAEKSWEQLRGVPVDREGEFVFTLRPRTDKYPARVLCEVKVVDNVKIITIRSTYQVENLTLYPLELMLVDDRGQPAYSLERIVPGHEFSLPVEVASKYRIRIQPDQGFGYKWCAPIRWEDLISRKSFAVKCAHGDPKEPAFRFQAWVQTDAQDLAAGKYPKINLKLRAPIELENLLPYNIEYRIYDKNTNQNWKSYLRKGGIMPIHSVELNHFILLNVAIQDSVFKPSDFAIINTDGNSDFDIEKKVTLQDQQNRKLDLGLNYMRYPDSGGAFKVQVFSPYVVVNKTGLPFAIRSTRSTRAGFQDAAGPSQPDALRTTAPFLLSHSHPGGHEFIFQFSSSPWSKMISVEAPSAETELVVPTQKQSPDRYYMGVSWTEGLGKYKLSKVITLAPRFLIRNLLPDSIAFREHGVAPRERSVVTPGDRGVLNVLRSAEEKLLTIAYPGLNAQWSPPISLEDIGVVHVRLKRLTPEGTSQIDLIRAEITIESSTIFVILSKSDDWPFELENDTDYAFKFLQKDDSREPDKPQVTYSLPPRSKTKYAWDFPAAKGKRILLSVNDTRRVVDIMEIGALMPFKFTQNHRTKAVSLDVRADGPKQILRITDYNPERSLYKPKQRSNSMSVSRQDTMSSTVDGFEAVTEEIHPQLTFTLDLAGIGVSLVNRRLIEVIYATFDQLKFEYVDSSVAQAVTLSCGSLQIDNQLHDALFPVILQPTPISKDAADVGALPTVQASVIWLKDQAHGVLFVKYCSILLQALTIEADEDLLFSIYDLTQIKGLSWEDETQDVLIRNADDIPDPDPSTSTAGQVLYFEVLELQPILLALSFMRTERVSSEEKMSIRNPLAVVLNAMTMAVGNINDAPLEMNALAIKDMRLTTADLQNRILYHYRQEVLRQLYRILGSADFIGNPVGLFTNVSSGVADIFYEPFQGVVMHGNRELGIGIAKGAASFVKKTVFGLSDSVTKFTSSVGKGLSAATFDSEYQARRRMTQRRNKPRHAIYGVAAGGEAFASSVTSAMEGVFMKPIEGAESEGAFGFFKGVGKGLVGDLILSSAVTKPVVGVFDLASNVSEGIRNTTTVFDNPDRDRVRMPRLIPADGVLKSYSAREAMGQYWMKDLNNGAYRKELYVAHINSPGGDNVVLLTQSKVISFYSKRLRLDWELPFTQIQGVTAEDNGIRFAHRLGREHDKFAVIPDKASQTWFFNQVATVVKQFNTRRRMD
ncbi:hypothetical protein D9611_006808 [Ephemerocybe angulata]|uniref:Vacuolar protein sorting-associated protein 13 n=1 Tax=Ephemerocybe angulata TaxID=980116 RepID=A0A8H5AZT2_9AGAR|nr:hypothetical protein D9611_006808 [Tulosesus angulatus]